VLCRNENGAEFRPVICLPADYFAAAFAALGSAGSLKLAPD
jgi:hypothetical protein